jgi:hypothetical protein
MIRTPSTDSVGYYLRDMIGEGYIDDSSADSRDELDVIDYIDDSDASNLRLIMASGAVFRVAIIRES